MKSLVGPYLGVGGVWAEVVLGSSQTTDSEGIDGSILATQNSVRQGLDKECIELPIWGSYCPFTLQRVDGIHVFVGTRRP